MQFAFPLQGKTFYAGAIVVDDFVPSPGDVFTVTMRDRKAFTYIPSYENGMLLWTDDGRLEVGTYSVEVLVDRADGSHLRCLRLNQVNIVESTDESELDSEMTDGLYLEGDGRIYPRDVLSAGVFLFAGNGDLGIRNIAEDVFNTNIGPVITNIVNDYTALISTSVRNIIPEMWNTLVHNDGDYAGWLISAHHLPIGVGLEINPNTGLIDVTVGGAVESVAGLTGNITAQDLFSALGLGDAATYGIGAISDGNTGLVTGGAVYAAIQSIGPGGSGVSDVRFGNPSVTAEKDKLVVTKLGTDYYRDILFAQVASKTRFSYVLDGTSHTDSEFPIDWYIPEEYATGHYRLRLNPKYEGLIIGGWASVGGPNPGGGGGGSAVAWGADGGDYVRLNVNGVEKSLLTDHQPLSGYATETWVAEQDFLTNIDSSMVVTALGYTPADSDDFSDYLALSGGTMENTDLVQNLNADLLDGIHASGFWQKSLAYDMPYCDLASIPRGVSQCGGFGWEDYEHHDNAGGGFVTFYTGSSLHSLLMVFPSYDLSSEPILYSSIDNGAWGNPHTLAYLTSNVASATQLQTARSIWGQSFNGTSDVDGDITVNGDGYFSGNVGIGVQSPSNKLDVAGIIHATTGIYTEGYGAFGGVGSSSDARLKDGIEDVYSDRALSVLMQLKPKEWTWNEKNGYFSGRKGAGLVAQDVEGILPFAVIDEGEYKSLTYSVFHAYEIAGLQNHEARIAELERKIESYAER
jgi:hypothetical protein